VVERHDQPPLATFFAEAELAAARTIVLSDDATHHARVKRLVVGDIVALTNGLGTRARASISVMRKGALECEIDQVEELPPPPLLHVRAPIADRDRMLWLAEKATELGITSWQGVRFRRSMSVSPRGEGTAFVTKVRLRTIAALEQSGAAWLPTVLPDVDLDALDPVDGDAAFVLDAAGPPLLGVFGEMRGRAPTILIGPEGGIEPNELAELEVRGWRRARLASSTLRFETAGVAAIGVIRAAQLLNQE
jgi:16S rRNA (uracil1498-N3)-methyltransferase